MNIPMPANLSPPARAHSPLSPVADGEELLRPGDVAKLFRVDPKTVTRWCQQGKIKSVRTPGGHRRILRSSVTAILEAGHG